MNPDLQLRNTVLLVGASRGLGYAMAEEFLKRGWDVVGTVRGHAKTRLHELAGHFPGRLEIETVDITMPDQIAALRSRLADRKLDILFVNAGVTNNPNETIGEVSTEEGVHSRHGHQWSGPDARGGGSLWHRCRGWHDRSDVLRPGQRLE
jgi:NAD(P)-dependent dehydrogenase (short-subunit alcohol dehydrogenase family)